MGKPSKSAPNAAHAVRPPTLRNDKGQIVAGSGPLNPLGRKPSKGIAALCRDIADDINVPGLLALTATGVNGAGHRERLEAIKLITAYAWGRPIEAHVEITAAPGSDLSDGALEQLARSLATPLATVTPLAESIPPLDLEKVG